MGRPRCPPRSLCERDFSLCFEGDISFGTSILKLGLSFFKASGERVTIVVRRGRVRGGVMGRIGESAALIISEGIVGSVASVKLLLRDSAGDFTRGDTSTSNLNGDGDGGSPCVLVDALSSRLLSSTVDSNPEPVTDRKDSYPSAKIWFAGKILRAIREARRELLLLPFSELALGERSPDVFCISSRRCSTATFAELRFGRLSADVRPETRGAGNGDNGGSLLEAAKF